MSVRVLAIILVLGTVDYNGIDTGLNPGPDVRKEQGPLVAPPSAVLRGTAM